jgi:hypothetical protein
MGAETFIVETEGRNAKKAFNKARDEACYLYGHAGYSGTLAEKTSFIMIDDVPANVTDFEAYADDLIERGDSRIDDKWGPAGCIDCRDGTYIFFGWASS